MINKIFVFCIIILLCSCYSQRPTTVPIADFKYLSSSSNIDHLVIFLVGIGDNVNAFEQSGFFKQSKKSNFNSIVVDSHFGYYKEHSISTRVYEDILKPNRDKYNKITLLGVSLGGYGAIKTATDYPSFVDNIILIAPFLGSKESAKALIDFDSLDTWRVTDNSNLGYFDDSWQLLHKVITVQKTPMILAFGEQDKFAIQSNQLAKYLKQNDVVRIKGGHNWRTWSEIWNKLLTLKMI